MLRTETVICDSDDLRKGLIAKVQGHTISPCQPGTPAVLFTKTYGRVVTPGLGMLDLRLPEDVMARSRLGTACHSFERNLDESI